jgi:hypothetical protein
MGRQGSAADAAERAESITIDFLNQHLALNPPTAHSSRNT